MKNLGKLLKRTPQGDFGNKASRRESFCRAELKNGRNMRRKEVTFRLLSEFNSLFRHGRDVWHQHLVDEGSETQAEVGCDISHRVGQQIAEMRKFLFVVFHGF